MLSQTKKTWFLIVPPGTDRTWKTLWKHLFVSELQKRNETERWAYMKFSAHFFILYSSLPGWEFHLHRPTARHTVWYRVICRLWSHFYVLLNETSRPVCSEASFVYIFNVCFVLMLFYNRVLLINNSRLLYYLILVLFIVILLTAVWWCVELEPDYLRLCKTTLSLCCRFLWVSLGLNLMLC